MPESLEHGRLVQMLREQAGLSAQFAARGDHRHAWSTLASAVERFLAGAIATPEQAALLRIADALEAGLFIRSRQS